MAHWRRRLWHESDPGRDRSHRVEDRRYLAPPDRRAWRELSVSPQLLIHHDEDAEVYVNGRRIGKLKGFSTSYSLLPLGDDVAGAFKPGKNSSPLLPPDGRRPVYRCRPGGFYRTGQGQVTGHRGFSRLSRPGSAEPTSAARCQRGAASCGSCPGSVGSSAYPDRRFSESFSRTRTDERHLFRTYSPTEFRASWRRFLTPENRYNRTWHKTANRLILPALDGFIPSGPSGRERRGAINWQKACPKPAFHAAKPKILSYIGDRR